MHIESLSIRNFKCFGDIPVKINIRPGVTCFIGDNGAGKTSALEALKRLFSPESSERQLRRSDVHFGPGEDSQSVRERQVVIDVVFGLSEQPKNSSLLFQDAFSSGADQSLKMRLVLEGRYIRAESYEDDIDVEFYTVRTLNDIPFGSDDHRKIPFRRRVTSLAEFVYMPAHRDSLEVTQRVLKKLLERIERSAIWSERIRHQSKRSAKKLEGDLNNAEAIKGIARDLQTYWRKLHDGHYEMNPVISVLSTEFEKLIRDLSLRFEKTPGGGQRRLEELSEGQVSLLYFSLSATLYNLLWKMRKKMQEHGSRKLRGFKPIDFEPPPFTIFALEEPENHLSPFYLPRLVGFLEELNREGSAQSFMTSHSASILARVPPRNVRYFRNHRRSLISEVKEMNLPNKGSKEDKFLHQVILANPEIYFARLVIIGEGHSERIVIPRIAEALGITLDPSFVAFVPIGGRHAKDLWHALEALGIDYVTLLDFDLGRHGGGMGRIKDAISWLRSAREKIKHLGNDSPLPLDNEIPSNNDLDSDQTAQNWLKWMIRRFKIFYAYPLDLDMMMLQAYPDAYVPNSRRSRHANDKEMDEIKKSVFRKAGRGNIDLARVGRSFDDETLSKYDDLFKSRTKISSHYDALARLNEKTIRDFCPEILQELVNVVATSLKQTNAR